MGGYPRYCVQCGSGLTPDTRFCGNCGQATTAAAAETDPRAIEVSAAAAETRPGGPPPPSSPAGRWRDASTSSTTTPDLVKPPGFAAPPTGPAYPTPRPSPAEPSARSSPAELSPPSSSVLPSSVLPPTESVTPPSGRPMPPPPDRPGTGPRPTYLPAQDRAGSGPRPAYPPPPAQYALSSGPPPPPPPAVAGPGGETAKFGTNWTDQVGFKPQWEQAPPGSQWPQGPPPPVTARIRPADGRPADGQPRKRQFLSIGLFALIAAVLVVPALLIVHALHGLGGSSAAAAEPTAKPSKSAPAAATEHSAATALAGLLAQSVTDRDTIVSAVGAVNHCTSAVNQAPAQFQEGATSRQKLLKQLTSMAGRSELPAAMLQQLTTAWQASATVDTDLSKWAQDEVSTGCHAHNDANLAASDGPDSQATNAKSAFVSLWNPIAAKYGLTRYSTSQL